MRYATTTLKRHIRLWKTMIYTSISAHLDITQKNFPPMGYFPRYPVSPGTISHCLPKWDIMGYWCDIPPATQKPCKTMKNNDLRHDQANHNIPLKIFSPMWYFPPPISQGSALFKAKAARKAAFAIWISKFRKKSWTTCSGQSWKCPYCHPGQWA